MSSMVQAAYDMGITTSLGGMPHDSFYRDDYSSRRSYSQPAKKRSHGFDTAQEAQNYAKANPGTIITRASDGKGYIIKE